MPGRRLVELPCERGLVRERRGADGADADVGRDAVGREAKRPEALIVPVGSIRRIELRKAAEQNVAFGFSVPS